MLAHPYSYYFFGTLNAALWTLPGSIAILLLVLALFVKLRRSSNPSIHSRITAVLVATAFVTLTFAFYTVTIEIETQAPDLTAAQTKEFADDADCGTAWSPWTVSGVGILNPCGKGCYRGLTLHQERRMSGFPPWPETRREFHCWVRKTAAERDRPVTGKADILTAPLQAGE